MGKAQGVQRPLQAGSGELHRLARRRAGVPGASQRRQPKGVQVRPRQLQEVGRRLVQPRFRLQLGRGGVRFVGDDGPVGPVRDAVRAGVHHLHGEPVPGVALRVRPAHHPSLHLPPRHALVAPHPTRCALPKGVVPRAHRHVGSQVLCAVALQQGARRHGGHQSAVAGAEGRDRHPAGPTRAHEADVQRSGEESGRAAGSDGEVLGAAELREIPEGGVRAADWGARGAHRQDGGGRGAARGGQRVRAAKVRRAGGGKQRSAG
mmetsp:Transcript_7703/g.14199  ORF Transcript_7703/g.14199 Transcript_7703/m.14199 type:complete len:262 (-) Transcript_7703:4188-4973(-)